MWVDGLYYVDIKSKFFNRTQEQIFNRISVLNEHSIEAPTHYPVITDIQTHHQV